MSPLALNGLEIFPTAKGRVLLSQFRHCQKGPSASASRDIQFRSQESSEKKIPYLKLESPRIRRIRRENPSLDRTAGRQRNYTLIVLDPLYKLLGNRDENSASDMSNLMNQVEQITVKTLAAIAFGTHFSKGNQSQKNAIDRMFGSGVLARDPDAIIVSTEHNQENAFAVSMILRNLPPQPEFAMRFQSPVMVADDTLDPDDLKQPGGRPSESANRQTKILETLRDQKGLSQSKLQEATNIPLTTLKRELKKLVDSGRVFHSTLDATYAVKY